MSVGVKIANLPRVSEQEAQGTDDFVVVHGVDNQASKMSLNVVAAFAEKAFSNNEILLGRFPVGDIDNLSWKFQEHTTTGAYLSDPANGKVSFVSGGNPVFSFDPSGVNLDQLKVTDINMTGSINNALAIGQQKSQYKDYSFEPRELFHLSSPDAARLLIEADVNNVDENANAQILLEQDGGTVQGHLGYWNGTNSIYIWNKYAEDLVLGTNDGEMIRLSRNGNVGVGSFSETQPGEKLTVLGNIRSSNVFVSSNQSTEPNSLTRKDYVDKAASNAQSNAESYADGKFAPKSNPHFTGDLSVDGKVSIGQKSATEQLHVDGVIRSDTNFTAPPGDSCGYTFIGREDVRVVSRDQNSISILTDNKQRMRVSDDRLFIFNGETSSVTDYGIKFLPSSTQSTILAIYRQANNGSVAEFGRGGNPCGNITVTSDSTSYNTASDYRLKENVQPMQNALDKVAQLKPVTYTWKSDGSDGQGFIAHELQSVIPDAVNGEKDQTKALGNIYDENGNLYESDVEKPSKLPDGHHWEYTHDELDPQGVDPSKIVATLTAAIQEQQAQIEALQAEVQALKDKA